MVSVGKKKRSLLSVVVAVIFFLVTKKKKKNENVGLLLFSLSTDLIMFMHIFF